MEIYVKNINPYLVEGNDITIQKLTKPICSVPKMFFGSMPNDGGHLTFNKFEKIKLIDENPNAKKYIKPFLMGRELIHGIPRYCLWLVNCSPNELKKMSSILKKIEKVQVLRSSSSRKATQKLAKYPSLFGEIRQPKTFYIAFPAVTSKNRVYIPIKILSPNVIAGNKIYTISTNSCYILGLISSIMHMTWVKYISGRLKSDYSYSNTIVYNNFPFPKNVDAKHQKKVEKAAQKVLDTRANYPNSSLADLYDPLTMPPNLVKAHQQLDKAVDLCYRPQPFVNERNRIEFLFELYETYTAPMFVAPKKKRTRKK